MAPRRKKDGEKGVPVAVPPAKPQRGRCFASPRRDRLHTAGHASHHTPRWETGKEVCCEVLFAFCTVQYLRAEGWLLVQLTSHAGVSSWLAGALYLLQAEGGGKKRSITCRNKIQSLLIPN